jgi:hypothetical protein
MAFSDIHSIETFKASIDAGLAKPNKFLIEFPTMSSLSSTNTQEINLNLLCRACSFPFRQIFTAPRTIGMKTQLVTYGFGIQEVTFSFYETNNFPVRKYFNEWISSQIDLNSYELNFKRGGLSDNSGGYAKSVKIYSLDSRNNRTYGVELIDAFPVTINSVDFSNENDGLIDTTINMTYTDFIKVDTSNMERHI